ncbi:MAG: tRNA pseudouridine(54/55) synthase Pus10 [Thermoplasmatales archaeon]
MAACAVCQKRLNLKEPVGTPDECEYCGGILSRIDDFFEIFKDFYFQFEIGSFLIGVKADKNRLQKEMKVIEDEKLDIRNFKKEFESKLGSRIEDELHLKADFTKPDVIFTVDQRNLSYDFWIRPVFVVGRYRKNARGIPQSPWISPAPGREGRSISEYIGENIKDALGGTNYNFYASGREDVDALMLGDGRPFYVEVINPRKRKVEGAEITRKISESSGGNVEVLEPRIASEEEIDVLKRARPNKVYEVSFSTDRKLNDDLIRKLSSYSGIVISQRTPTRVLPIRKDISRKRTIFSIKVLNWSDYQVRLWIEAEAGTYIKEFITGDSGRTEPSISKDLKVNVKIDYLNVLSVK